MTHQTQPRATDAEITAHNLRQVLQQRKITGAVVTLLFDGPQFQTYRVSHFHARTRPEEIENLAGALATAGGVKNATVSRGDSVLYVEIPKPEPLRQPLSPQAMEQGKSPALWAVVLGVGVDGGRCGWT